MKVSLRLIRELVRGEKPYGADCRSVILTVGEVESLIEIAEGAKKYRDLYGPEKSLIGKKLDDALSKIEFVDD